MRKSIPLLCLTLAVVMVAALPADAAKRKAAKKRGVEEVLRPEEVGVLKYEDVAVVQKILYPHTGRTELGFHLGGHFFDPYAVGFIAGFDMTHFFKETGGLHVQICGGYGGPNQHHQDLTSNIFSDVGYTLGNDGRRILAGVTVAAELIPAYAKYNFFGKRVFHNDLYVLLGGTFYLGHGLLESSREGTRLRVIPGPMVGVGFRVFTGPKMNISIDIRDCISFEARAFSQTLGVRNNVILGVRIGGFVGEAKGATLD